MCAGVQHMLVVWRERWAAGNGGAVAVRVDVARRTVVEATATSLRIGDPRACVYGAGQFYVLDTSGSIQRVRESDGAVRDADPVRLSSATAIAWDGARIVGLHGIGARGLALNTYSPEGVASRPADLLMPVPGALAPNAEVRVDCVGTTCLAAFVCPSGGALLAAALRFRSDGTVLDSSVRLLPSGTVVDSIYGVVASDTNFLAMVKGNLTRSAVLPVAADAAPVSLAPQFDGDATAVWGGGFFGVLVDIGLRFRYRRYTREGAQVGTTADLFSLSGYWLKPTLAATGDGTTLITYPRDQALQRIWGRWLGNGDRGAPCGVATDCGTGFCVDGVCCNTACAGGTTDCQACSVAAGAPVDGTCGPAVATQVCRPAAAPCDAVERCDGTALACPPDLTSPVGTPCTGGTCMAGTCTPTPDAGAPLDAGAGDAGLADVGAGVTDLGSPDVGAPDVGAPDVGAPDVGALDAGAPDAGAPDVGVTDAGPVDVRTDVLVDAPVVSERDGALPDVVDARVDQSDAAGLDAPLSDAGSMDDVGYEVDRDGAAGADAAPPSGATGATGSCGCRVPAARGNSAASALALLALLPLRRRRSKPRA